MAFLEPQFIHGALLNGLHGIDSVGKKFISHGFFIGRNVAAQLIGCLGHAVLHFLRQLADESLRLIGSSGHMCKQQAQQLVMHQLHCEKSIFSFVHGDIGLWKEKV